LPELHPAQGRSLGAARQAKLFGQCKDPREQSKKQKKLAQGDRLDPSLLTESLMLALQAETLEFVFPYFELHRTCWQLLRDVKQRCNSLLMEKFTPDYMTSETQLPWVVGYLFWAAMGQGEDNGPVRVRDMRPLQTAESCFEDLFARGGKDHIMNLMRREMNLHVEVRTEEDGDDSD
jgi:hypothetical protein